MRHQSMMIIQEILELWNTAKTAKIDKRILTR